jgi:plastocyanin
MTPAVPGTALMRRMLTIAALAIGGAVLVAACAPASNPPVIPVQQSNPFVTFIVATGNDAGRSSSAAVADNGASSVSYLLLTPTLAAGQLAPAVVPNTPQPPAVVVASFDASKGFWTRTSASPQDYAKAEGTEASIADKDGKFLPGVNAALAVDAAGKQHVIWATPSGLFYTDNVASAAFADPDTVTKTGAAGGSIAVDKSGTPWIAYYQGDNVMVATKANGSWATQSVSLVTSCDACPPVRTAIAVSPDTGAITLAFTDGGSATPSVATAQAPSNGGLPSGWSVDRFGTGTGGFGISVALAKDGTPSVAYAGPDGKVYLATGFGGSGGATGSGTTPSVVSGASAPSRADPTGWTTGLGIDESGKVYVSFVDPAANAVRVGIGQAGSLTVTTLPLSGGGREPSIAVSGDGKTLVIPFYDVVNHQLAVSVPAQKGLVIGQPSPSPSPPPTAPSGPACSPTSDATSLQIAAPVGASASGFDPTCLAVVPQAAFTVAFDNQDSGVPHNWELFKDPAYATRVGGATGPTDVITGVDQASYSVDALAAGVYYFRCDVHPTTMIGQLVVGPVGGGSGSPQPGPTTSP